MSGTSSRAILSVVVAAGMVALAGCGPKPSPNRATPNDAVVYIASNVADANLYFDGRFVGPIKLLRGGIAVNPGKHRLELRHDDYFSRYLELDLQRAEHKRLVVQLAPVLP